MQVQFWAGTNTYIFEESDLTNDSTGEEINDATVEVTVYECESETEVDGTWPLVLTASGSGGYYSAIATLTLEKDKKYTATMITTSGDNVREASETVLAKVRRF